MATLASFIRRSGLCLIGAGALVVIINVALTPLLPRGGSFADTVSSAAFVWRQSLSALAAVLLMFGSMGVYLRQMHGAGRFVAPAFAMALVGSALLLAIEWTQVFEVRDLAMRAPDTLNRLDAEGMALDDVGALIAFAALTVGWIALSAVSRRSGLFPRHAPTLVIAGFFATPFLSAVLPPIVASAIGNTVLGCGWIWMGRSLQSLEQGWTS
jgi:hypothetical protein